MNIAAFTFITLVSLVQTSVTGGELAKSPAAHAAVAQQATRSTGPAIILADTEGGTFNTLAGAS